MTPGLFMSQSALKDFLLCEEKHRLVWQNGKDPEGKIDGFSMAREVGTAFDVYVKNMIDPMQKVIFDSWESKDHRIAMSRGLDIARAYERSGALELFKELGVHIIPRMKRQCQIGSVLVPLEGHLDIIKASGDPADFKVSGAGSKAYIKKGYKYCFKYKYGSYVYDRRPCERYGIPMEEINEDWAIQQVVYNILCGKRQSDPHRAHIEMVAVRGDVYDFATYDAPISPAFVDKVYAWIENSWKKIVAKEYATPFYQEYKCDRYYGQKCVVASICHAYNNRPSVSKAPDLGWLDR